jgi:S-formylglutathione hydrolase
MNPVKYPSLTAMATAGFEIKGKVKVFGGDLIRFSHHSRETKTPMTCSVFIPAPGGEADTKFPCLVYLSGLTCTDENVCQKSGVFKHLADNKV